MSHSISQSQLFGMDFKVADRFTMEWEAELIRQLLAYAQELEDEQEGFKLHISITRRYVRTWLSLSPILLFSVLHRIYEVKLSCRQAELGLATKSAVA